MIRLDTTTRKLQIILDSNIITNELPVTVSYSDKALSTYNGATQVSNTNSSTAVDICSSPASTVIRDIDYIQIYNRDTVIAKVTIRYDDNGTTYVLCSTTLMPGDTLTYSHGRGWLSLDSYGYEKLTERVNLVPLSPASYSVTSSSSQAVAANVSRKGLVIINMGAVNVSFGSGNTAVVGSGITITPNGTWVMDESTFTTLAINAICSSTSSLSIQEYN